MYPITGIALQEKLRSLHRDLRDLDSGLTQNLKCKESRKEEIKKEITQLQEDIETFRKL